MTDYLPKLRQAIGIAGGRRSPRIINSDIDEDAEGGPRPRADPRIAAETDVPRERH